MQASARGTSIERRLRGRSRELDTRIPALVSALTTIALILFMMQPRSFEIGFAPIQVVLIVLVFGWAVLFRGSALSTATSAFSPLQWISIAVLLISVLIRSVLDGWQILRLGQLIVGVMVALVGVLLFEDERGRSMIVKGLTLGAIASGGVGILQALDVAPWLWINTIYQDIGYTYGASGLEYTPVPFAYSILGIAVVLWGSWIILIRDGVKLLPMRPSILFVGCIVTLGGLIASRSRSGIIGLAAAIAIIALVGVEARAKEQAYSRGDDYHTRHGEHKASVRRILLWYLLGILILALVSYVVSLWEGSLLRDVRLALTWRAYAPVMLRNPFGLPGGADIFEALDHAGTIQYASALVRSSGLGLIAPHNLILTTGLSYGPLAALALLFLYSSALKQGASKLTRARRCANSAGAGWLLVVIGANVAIVVHSWFHNASIAVGEMRNWLWLAWLLSADLECRQTAPPRHDVAQENGRS